MELLRLCHVTPRISASLVFALLALIMTSQALLPCDVICSQGISVNNCDCDVTMQNQEQSTDATNEIIDKRADDMMYNKIFKWGKRRFSNPFPNTDERLMPIDNIERRIFRWGKRSSPDPKESRIFRWGKRASSPSSEYMDSALDQPMPLFGDDIPLFGDNYDHVITDETPEVTKRFARAYTSYGGRGRRLGALQSDLRQLLANEIKGEQDKRRLDRQVTNNRIFRFGKRVGDSSPYRTTDKREQQRLRKIFMWG